MDSHSRLIVLCLLCVLTVGLCTQYAGTDLWTYPSTEELSAEPAVHDSTRSLVFGTVQTVDRTAGTIAIDRPPYQVDIQAIDPAVVERLEPGSSIQVYGTVQDQSQRMIAHGVVIDIQHSADRLYIYGTSLLGAIFAAGVFLKSWRINWRGCCFEPRREH